MTSTRTGAVYFAGPLQSDGPPGGLPHPPPNRERVGPRERGGDTHSTHRMPLAERPIVFAFTRSSHWRPPQSCEVLPAHPQPSAEDPRAASSSPVCSSHTPRLPHRLVHHHTPDGGLQVERLRHQCIQPLSALLLTAGLERHGWLLAQSSIRAPGCAPSFPVPGSGYAERTDGESTAQRG